MIAAVAVAALSTHTTTTAYTYNADGAPPAVTTRVGSAPATTTYLAWDNFVPDNALRVREQIVGFANPAPRGGAPGSE